MSGWLPPGAQPVHALYFVAAVVASALLTALVKPLAIKADLVSRPRNDRWSRSVIPMGGGVAIYATLAPALILVGGWKSLDLVLALGAIHVLGLVDDKLRLSAPAKLVVQVGSACFLAFRGHVLPLGPELLAVPVTVGWYVFLANSVNLLDNMDGSAAGVSTVAAAFVYVLAAGGASPDPTLAAQAAVFSGAVLGFLLHNFPPASIFMGDAGSLVLGFALAGLSAELPHGSRADAPGTLLAPAIVLAIPIFDTALVWVTRRMAKRPFLLGGRDHVTHRLVALGLTERRTVLVLYGAAALLGAAALAVARGGLGTAVLAALAVAVGLLLCGVFLVDVRVYKKAEPAAPTSAPPPPGEPSPFLFAAELAIDVSVVTAAWVGAYVVKFADTDALDDYLRGSCLKALPFVIGLKLAALFAQGLYRAHLRSFRFDDAFRIGKAAALGSVLVVATAAIADRLKDYSREVFFLDAFFFAGGIAISRSAFRALRSSVARLAVEPRRAVLVGPRALLPLVERGLARDGRPPCAIVAILDPDAPEDVAAASGPAIYRRTLAEVAPTAESVGARVALVAAQADGLVRELSDRGIEVLNVSLTVE